MWGTAAAAASLLTVTRTSSEPARASAMHLADGAGDVGGVGIGHRLHHDGCIAADAHSAHRGGISLSTLNLSHTGLEKVYHGGRTGSRRPEPQASEPPQAKIGLVERQMGSEIGP